MDWKNLINQLTGLGLTQAEIAQKCECSQASVSDLCTGKSLEPKFGLGRRLLDLLEERKSATPGTEPAPAAIKVVATEGA